MFDLLVESEPKLIGTTGGHAVWSADRREWVTVQNLQVEERLLALNSTPRILSQRVGQEVTGCVQYTERSNNSALIVAAIQSPRDQRGEMMSSETQTPGSEEAFAEVLKHVCMRPKMYTFDGTFREVVIYLQGYIHASGFPAGQINLESGMEPFGRWLALRFDCDPNQSWHRILLKCCGGDERQAIQQLWPYYKDYLAVGENGGRTGQNCCPT